ncbi:MAG: hypothetical protein E7425_07840 [Ruminococcaceae bacterium]|nr:hypothetical protein [Oscillospiraceae bacterium]
MKYIVACGAGAIADLESAGFSRLPYREDVEIEGCFSISSDGKTSKEQALFAFTPALQYFFWREGVL